MADKIAVEIADATTKPTSKLTKARLLAMLESRDDTISSMGETIARKDKVSALKGRRILALEQDKFGLEKDKERLSAANENLYKRSCALKQQYNLAVALARTITQYGISDTAKIWRDINLEITQVHEYEVEINNYKTWRDIPTIVGGYI